MKPKRLLIFLGLVLWLFPNYAVSQDSAAKLIEIIEGVQHPNRQGLDPL